MLTSRRYAVSSKKRKPYPRLEFKEDFLDMVPSPFLRGDAHLVGPETFGGDDFLAIREELGFYGRVGHEPEDKDGVSHGEKTTEQEHYLDACQICIVVEWKAIPDRRTVCCYECVPDHK